MPGGSEVGGGSGVACDCWANDRAEAAVTRSTPMASDPNNASTNNTSRLRLTRLRPSVFEATSADIWITKRHDVILRYVVVCVHHPFAYRIRVRDGRLPNKELQ